MHAYFLRFARLSILSLLLLASAFADNSKISPDLLPLLKNPSNTVNVIVQYNSPPQTCSGGLLGGILCTAVTLLGGGVKIVFTLINAGAGNPGARQRLFPSE